MHFWLRRARSQRRSTEHNERKRSLRRPTASVRDGELNEPQHTGVGAGRVGLPVGGGVVDSLGALMNVPSILFYQPWPENLARACVNPSWRRAACHTRDGHWSWSLRCGLRQPFEDAGGAATSPRVGCAAPFWCTDSAGACTHRSTALCVKCARLMFDALSSMFFVEVEWFRP